MASTESLHPFAQLCAEALLRDPARPAVEFERRWFTWGELAQVAAQVDQLLTDAGVPKEATVAFLPRNRPTSIAALLGLLAGGQRVRMVDAFQSGAATARNLTQIAPAGAVLDAEDLSEPLLAVLRERGIATVTLGDTKITLAGGLERTGIRETPATEVRLPPSLEILTGDSTGPPKSFPIDYELLTHFVIEASAALEDIDPLAQPPPLLCFPLGHITGIRSTLPPLILGQSLVVLERFSLEGWHDYVMRFRPAAAGMPPAGLGMLFDANLPAEDLASLTMLGTGATDLDPVRHRSFERHYGIPILLSYGTTEFGGPVAAMTPELHATWGESKFGSCGTALPGSRLRVVDPATGAELPPGEEGLLEAIAPRMGSQWIRTADFAVIDKDGFLFLRGHDEGAIHKYGSFELLPETIENALLEHPAISAAGVAGLPDERRGEVAVAAVQLKLGATKPATAELEAHLRKRIPAAYIPVAWHFVESMPRTTSFKVDQRALRRLLSQAKTWR